jgi:hypothetical protein
MDSSSSHTNLTMTKPVRFTVSTNSSLPTTSVSTGSRHVRFHFNGNGHPRNHTDIHINRHTRSFDDVRVQPEKHSRHRVEFQIPIHRGI